MATEAAALTPLTPAPVPPAEAAPTPLSNFGQRLAGLTRGQKMQLVLGVVLLVVIALAGVLMSRQTEWRVLYSGLSDKDGGAVVAQLATMQVPYKYTEGGGAIMVPAERVHDTRLRMASLGLPKGSVTGFELMENSRFGATQFQERVTFQRGLEGELTRSIQSLSSVQSARVHLALPNQNGFFREQQKPSASVLLSLYPGRMLDRSQIAGIVHLVASSVPEMKPEAVSVLDDSGKLLSQSPNAADEGIDLQKLQYVQRIEAQLRQRVLDILEPVVGPGNVKAQVTADVDFSQSEQTSETHTPNQTPESGAVRSHQSLETSQPAAAGPGGVPGAVSNQPPAPNAAPINGPAQALNPALPGANGARNGTAQSAPPVTTRKESVTNYEVDKTVRVVRAASGVVKRLTAAVVVNQQTVTDNRGRVSTVALTPEQIAQMTALVRESIGFNADRGDSVNLMNAPFVLDKTPPVELAFWERPEIQELMRDLAWPAVAVLLAALVLLGVVRPVLKALNEKPQLEAAADDELDRPGLEEFKPYEPSERERALTNARQLARENPSAVAGIVKGWMGGRDDMLSVSPSSMVG